MRSLKRSVLGRAVEHDVFCADEGRIGASSEKVKKHLFL